MSTALGGNTPPPTETKTTGHAGLDAAAKFAEPFYRKTNEQQRQADEQTHAPGAHGAHTKDVLFGGSAAAESEIDRVIGPHTMNYVDSAVAGVDVAGTRTDLRQLHEETGLPPHVVGAIARGVVEDRRGEARGRFADDATLQAGREKATAAVINRFGVEEGARLMATARAFVSATPALAKLVNGSRTGNDPAVVLGIIDHIRATGWKG